MVSIEGIKVFDATLRDGGLVNDFYFPEGFARAVYEVNLAAGVDFMEFGYRADRKQFDPAKFGKWKFTSDEDIREVVGENRTKMKLSIMVDVGRCDYKNDIHPKSESPLDVIRVATYIDTIPEAIKMIEYADRMGYETTCNLMAVSVCDTEQIKAALKDLAKSPVAATYVVDSYGALYPKEIRKLTRMYRDIMIPAGKLVGIHAHNNQQCAFANTLESKEVGAKYIDATINGMGRGAGNCPMEALLGYLNGAKYHVEPILDFVGKEMQELKDNGIEWGYNTSYLISGLTNQHPRGAIEASKAKNTDFVQQYKYHTFDN